MFAHFVAAAILALPLFASAQSCDTGSLRCCDNVQDVDSDSGAGIAGLLGIVLQPGTQLGFGCNPIGVIGDIANGGACEAHPVCCDQDAVGDLINVGCVPINVL